MLPCWHGRFQEELYRRGLARAGLETAFGAAWRTFDALLGYANGDGRAYAFIATIAARIAATPRTVLRHLRTLDRLGAIVRAHVGRRVGGRRNDYWIVPLGRIKRRLGRRLAPPSPSSAMSPLPPADVTSPRPDLLSEIDKAGNGGGKDDAGLTSRGPGLARSPDGPPPPPAREDPQPGDVTTLVEDAAARLDLDLAAAPALAGRMRRAARQLLRAHGGALAEWLAVQRFELSGYGLDYWRDKLYTPAALPLTREYWRRNGRPAEKPAERRGAGREGRQGRRGRGPGPMARVEAYWRERERMLRPPDADAILNGPRTPCCDFPVVLGGHTWDCPTLASGGSAS